VLHSPWVRAAKTADRLGPLLDGPCEATPLLCEPADDATARALLVALGGARCAACIGHEPFLTELAHHLLPHGAGAPLPALRWKKGGVAWFAADVPAPGGFALRAFLPPSILRACGIGR
jgi:phosphohistidine phosphatase SixA